MSRCLVKKQRASMGARAPTRDSQFKPELVSRHVYSIHDQMAAAAAGTHPLHCMSMSHFSFDKVWLFLHLNECIIEYITPKRNLDSPRKLGGGRFSIATATATAARVSGTGGLLKSAAVERLSTTLHTDCKV